MKTYKDIFTFKTFWGRYMIFSVVSLIFSFAVFAEDNPDFPDKSTHLFFKYFGSHLLYWGLYVMISLQFMMVKKSKFGFSQYIGLVTFLMALGGIITSSRGIYEAFKHGSIYPIGVCSMSSALFLVSYQLYLDGKNINSSKSNKLY